MKAGLHWYKLYFPWTSELETRGQVPGLNNPGIVSAGKLDEKSSSALLAVLWLCRPGHRVGSVTLFVSWGQKGCLIPRQKEDNGVLPSS